MASDTSQEQPGKITGRCYCGARVLQADQGPEAVAYCHCMDCRRLCGAPVAAFAAFATDRIAFTPALDEGFSTTPGITRWFCRTCGSPLAATYAYLPGQIYVPLGLLDQAADLPPRLHAHADARLTWLHIHDDMPRIEGSSRDQLKAAHRT
ncbi:GFA family protein [Aestuariivita sp.]|uniref:GFA family protein n=1 Tax=Aestuariivita sp. TaxID=1872407 RepID=UPI0025BAFAE2|nr:GFA family protein [Aestuariivita sp.]